MGAPVGIGRYALVGALALHLCAITLVSLREFSWLVANKLTLAPPGWCAPAQAVEDRVLGILGENLKPRRLYREIVSTYLHDAGIQGGYGFFAPNISDSSRLTFEFLFPDGHSEFDLPHVRSKESALRLAGLLDEIGRTRIDLLREELVKLLAQQAWRDHAAAVSVKATFSQLSAPESSNAVTMEKPLYSFDLSPSAGAQRP